MSYKYEDIKPMIFSEDGQNMFLRIRDHITDILSVAGAIRMQEAISVATGDSWQMLACVDRMVEIGELREVTGIGVPGQYRVFVGVF
jgi:hypothetical protein